MRQLRPDRRIATVALACSLIAASAPAFAQIKTTVGKIIGGSSLHIPTYVAMSRGMYKAEGLDATFVTLGGRPLVTAGMTGSIDFVPIPSGAATAALSGAEIRYVVGESLRSHWFIVSRAGIAKPEDLKSKTVAYGRAGSADYDEGAAVMLRAFKMEAGKDYKVISFAGEPERVAALVNASVEAALVSVAQVPQAVNAGMKVLVRVSDHIERAGGTLWTMKAFADKNPETVQKFIRAIAKATIYYRENKAGSVPVLVEHFGISEKDAGTVWDETYNTFSPALPKEAFREIFESRRISMIDEKQWSKDKPLPDPEQWLLRDVLEKTLKDMGYQEMKK